MSLRKLRQWAASVHARKRGAPSEAPTRAANEEAKTLFAMREDLIQGIAGHLLDALAVGFNPADLGIEAVELCNQVLAGKAGLDIEWLENRRKHASTREPFDVQQARRRPEVEEPLEAGDEVENDEDKEWEH